MRLPGFPTMSRERLDRLRNELFKKQAAHAAATVPFYRDLFARRGLSPDRIRDLRDLSMFPVVSKSDIVEDDARFLSDRYAPTQLTKSHTSGSTGSPFTSYFDPVYWMRKKYYSKLRARMICGFVPGEKTAVLECEPQETVARKNASFSTHRVLRMRFFSIFEDPVLVLSDMARFDPTTIYGYPAFLFELAGLMAEKKVGLPQLSRIFTSSEYLQPGVRSTIEIAFGASVYDHYGCTETKEIAWQCKAKNGYHVNEDELIVEIVENGEPVPPGTPGEVVVTDLLNRAMPFVRYRVGDRAVMCETPCVCGRTFTTMRPLAGRASDHVILPGGIKLTPYRFTTTVENAPGVLQYQIVQEDESTITIRLVARRDMEQKAAAAVEKAVREVTKDMMSVRTAFFDKISVEENGKFKVVKSKLASAGDMPDKTSPLS